MRLDRGVADVGPLNSLLRNSTSGDNMNPRVSLSFKKNRVPDTCVSTNMMDNSLSLKGNIPSVGQEIPSLL